MMRYERAVEIKRRPWERRIEVFSPKLRRRLTLHSRDAHDAWLLLESDSRVKDFCERPTFLESGIGRPLDFWIAEGRHEKFWMLCTNESTPEPYPRSALGLPLKIIRKPDLIALGTRIQNWSHIVPYRVSYAGHAERRLQRDILTRLEKPHRLERLEAAFHPFDVNLVRAALFELLAAGDVIAPDMDTNPLGLTTVFTRASR